MKKQFAQLVMLIIVFGALLIGSGCAFIDKQVVLNKVHADQIAKVDNSNLIVKVGMPEDNRGKNPNFIGYVRNGYGIHTADVNMNKPVSLWVQEIIISNLEKAGIKVQSLNDNSGGNDGIFVETKIAKLSCDIGTQYKADINLLIKLKNRGSVVLNEVYLGQAAKVNWWGGASGYSEITEKAMKLCISKLMPELIKTIKASEKSIQKLNKITKSSDLKIDKKLVSSVNTKPKEVKSKKKNELPAFLK